MQANMQKKGKTHKKKHSINANIIFLQFYWRKQVLAHPQHSTTTISVSVPATMPLDVFLQSKKTLPRGLKEKTLANENVEFWAVSNFGFNFVAVDQSKPGENFTSHDVMLVNQLVDMM